MSIDHFSRLPRRPCPSIEGILACERTIVPVDAIVRARALTRARAALQAFDEVSLARHLAPGRNRRRLFVAAASMALMASFVGAFSLARSLPMGGHLQKPTRYTQVAPPSAPSEAAPPAAPKALPRLGPPTPSIVPTGTPGAAREASQTDNSGKVFDELQLLERAQKSNARGDFVAALAVTTDHERRFPTGQLCEERDVLRLRALLGLGRDSEARLVAERFRRDYPLSIVLRTLNEILAASP
jgi:hypothetical protein